MRVYNYGNSVIVLTTCTVMSYLNRMAIPRTTNKRLNIDKVPIDQALFLPCSRRDILDPKVTLHQNSKENHLKMNIRSCTTPVL